MNEEEKLLTVGMLRAYFTSPLNYNEDEPYKPNLTPITINGEPLFFFATPTESLFNIIFKDTLTPHVLKPWTVEELKNILLTITNDELPVSIDLEKKISLEVSSQNWNFVADLPEKPKKKIFVTPGTYYAHKFKEHYNVEFLDAEGNVDIEKELEYINRLALVNNQLMKYLSIKCIDAKPVSYSGLAGSAVIPPGAFSGQIDGFNNIIIFDNICFECGAKAMEVGGPIEDPQTKEPMCPVCGNKGREGYDAEIEKEDEENKE